MGELGSQNCFDVELGLRFSDKVAQAHFDDTPVRGTQSIDEIYQRVDVALLEPASYFKGIIIFGVGSQGRALYNFLHTLTVIRLDQWMIYEVPLLTRICSTLFEFKATINSCSSHS